MQMGHPHPWDFNAMKHCDMRLPNKINGAKRLNYQSCPDDTDRKHVPDKNVASGYAMKIIMKAVGKSNYRAAVAKKGPESAYPAHGKYSQVSNISHSLVVSLQAIFKTKMTVFDLGPHY